MRTAFAPSPVSSGLRAARRSTNSRPTRPDTTVYWSSYQGTNLRNHLRLEIQSFRLLNSVPLKTIATTGGDDRFSHTSTKSPTRIASRMRLRLGKSSHMVHLGNGIGPTRSGTQRLAYASGVASGSWSTWASCSGGAGRCLFHSPW